MKSVTHEQEKFVEYREKTNKDTHERYRYRELSQGLS